ncbi:MAG: hypothetical protein ABI148_03470 [Ginsengibacter sp.]
MNKIISLLFLFVALLFSNCSSDETSVQIIRTPLLQFDLSPTDKWVANNYSIKNTSKVVVYPEDSSLPAQLYNRYTLQGSGKDDLGKTYQLVINFDKSDSSQFVGIYKTAYNTERGIAQVQIFDLTDKNNLSVYNLCADDLQNDVLQILKEKPDENIITGTFQMTLCNSRDSTQKLTIMNGTIKDLKY